MPLASGFFYFPSTACSAWPIVLTRISSRLSRPVSLSVFCQGTTHLWKPRRCTSHRRCPMLCTLRSSPVRPTSPIAARSLPTGCIQITGRQCNHDRQVRCRLVQRKAADHVEIGIAVGNFQPSRFSKTAISMALRL